MSGFFCFIWWFILGVLVGWLLNWLLSRVFAKPDNTRTAPSSAMLNTLVSDTSASVVGNINTVAAAAAGIVVKGEDDLTVIEGIGPKIAEVLRNSGITTLSALSHKTPEELAAVLEAAGPRYKLANPSTWAMQADLAANNHWVELKKLQDELIGGVFVTDDHQA